MPQPYSADLRQRVLHALEKSPLKRSEIAAQYEISPATLYNWQKQLKEENRSRAKPHAGGKPTHDRGVAERLPGEDGRGDWLLLRAPPAGVARTDEEEKRRSTPVSSCARK
jgi:transposase